MWILAKINKDPIVVTDNDTVDKYILLSNGHDGLMSVRAGLTPIRVVCNNTLSMSHSSAESKLIRLKHTRSLNKNLEKVAEIMNLANNAFEATAEQYRFLASKSINQEDLEKFVKLVFVGPNYEQMEKNGLSPAKRVLEKVIPLFEKGRGNDLPGIKHTGWAAYNAINEYLQYERGHNSEMESKMDKMWFGDSANYNKKALDTITKMVA